MLGSCVTVSIAWKFTVGVGEVQHKVATQANENGKTETLTVIRKVTGNVSEKSGE